MGHCEKLRGHVMFTCDDVLSLQKPSLVSHPNRSILDELFNSLPVANVAKLLIEDNFKEIYGKTFQNVCVWFNYISILHDICKNTYVLVDFFCVQE